MAVRPPIARPDDPNLQSIWILSCFDENPMMTYKGIGGRIQLPEEDVKALVQSRRELFRPGVPPERLTEWTTKMRSGKSLPRWIAAISDEAAQSKAINELSKDDVFRNQFRLGANAPKCSIEIVDWGLNLIDRLIDRQRTIVAEEKEAKVKYWGTIIVPMLSLILGLILGNYTVDVPTYMM